MDWIYVRYVQITPRDLMRNQDKIQATYKAEELIEILFNQMETGQEFTMTRNTPFSERNLVDMGVDKILSTQ